MFVVAMLAVSQIAGALFGFWDNQVEEAEPRRPAAPIT